jgi:hypothetical protein
MRLDYFQGILIVLEDLCISVVVGNRMDPQ